MKILLIDNNVEDINYFKEIIIKSSHKEYLIIDINTLDQGIKILKSGKIEMILLNLFLPHTEDFYGLKKILTLFPEIPVIVFTNLGNEELGTNAIDMGARNYLVKGAINRTGFINSIQNSIIRHSIKVKIEHLNIYLTNNLDNLKKVIHYCQKTNNLPVFSNIYRELREKIHDFLFTPVFSLFLLNKTTHQLILIAHNRPDWKDKTEPSILTDKSSIMFEAVRRKKIIKNDEFSQNDKIQGSNQSICIPLVINYEVLGVLNLNNVITPYYTPAFLIKLKMVIHYLTISIRNNFIDKKLEELLLTDDLTGLYNRRYLLWELNREIKRVKRYRGILSILFIDIDNFKYINNFYGYNTGDFVLKKISIQLNKMIRTTDLIGRYSGEEFIAILTETNNKGAQILKRRIQKKISQYKIEIKGKKPIHIRVNIKCAEYDNKIKDADEFVDYVNKLLEEKENEEEISSLIPIDEGQKDGTGNGQELKDHDLKASESKVSEPKGKEKQDVTAMHYVRIFFIEPLQLISVVIDTLVKMGFESYQVDDKDKVKLLKILDKNARNVIFICISNQNQVDSWFEYINKVKQQQGYLIQIGAFVYSRIESHYSMRFLERNIALIKFSDIQQDTLSVLKKILFYFEARGRRGFVRAEAVEDSTAFFTIEGERKVIKAKILTMSEQIFSCYFIQSDVHHIVPGRYFLKVLLRLKGIVVQISTKVLTSKKDDPQLCVMQICSAIYKNNKISYTSGLKKETKDKLHRYIRFCLKENIKKKLRKVKD